MLTPFPAPSNALPVLFEVAQRDVQQRCDGYCHFNADVASCARNWALVPDLVHRRNDERKAQHTCRQSSCAEREPGRHVPGSEVVQRKVCPAKVDVLYQDRSCPAPCSCTPNGQPSRHRQLERTHRAPAQ
jgi:hypothetical protein